MNKKVNGFSLVELVVTIAIMGIIASIGMVAYSRVINNVRESVAWDKAEILNYGLKKYSQMFHEMPSAPGTPTEPDPDSTADEFLVLRSLQWKDPTDPTVGAPYARTDYNPIESSSTDDYRLRWNGFVFEVLNPGTAGMGLKVCDDGSDLTTNHTFLPGYSPE